MYRIVCALILAGITSGNEIPVESIPVQEQIIQDTPPDKAQEAVIVPEKPANQPGVWGRKTDGNFFTLKPEMLRTFYIFLGLSFVLMALIGLRIYRLRSHRAERRYGVQGDRSCQELTHLPSAMEETESEAEEDETLFDINKMRVYVA